MSKTWFQIGQWYYTIHRQIVRVNHLTFRGRFFPLMPMPDWIPPRLPSPLPGEGEKIQHHTTAAVPPQRGAGLIPFSPRRGEGGRGERGHVASWCDLSKKLPVVSVSWLFQTVSYRIMSGNIIRDCVVGIIDVAGPYMLVVPLSSTSCSQ